MFGLIRSWRRNRILRSSALDSALWGRVAVRFAFVQRLTEEERTRLRELSILFLHEKQLSAAGGLELSDEMRLGIAIQACILILNLGLDSYSGWVEIIVYPDEFVPRREYRNEHGLVELDHASYAGQAWLQGPVILSWADVEHAWLADGANVVIHEFAHKLDMLNGDANGFPPLHAGMSREEWTQALAAAYEHFVRDVESGRYTEIDPYAAESPGEFFAVLSEAFFETPEVIEESYPAVYRQLSLFYKQDPARRELPREFRLRKP
jgi:Mlc titration factor MtfA (ptsG expression regulator)